MQFDYNVVVKCVVIELYIGKVGGFVGVFVNDKGYVLDDIEVVKFYFWVDGLVICCGVYCFNGMIYCGVICF